MEVYLKEQLRIFNIFIENEFQVFWRGDLRLDFNDLIEQKRRCIEIHRAFVIEDRSKDECKASVKTLNLIRDEYNIIIHHTID